RETIRKWKQYGKLSDLGEISRRKFFNNCFDGALTTAGLVSGIFMIFLAASSTIQFTPLNVLMTGFATAIAIGISGLWGAFLSEEAERKKKVDGLKRDMAIIEDSDEKENNNGKNSKKTKTILEKAENFATIVASLVDGGAPAIGSVLPLIPFFFGVTLTIMHFIFSYIILAALLVYLGIFLGNISGGGKLRYALHLVTAGIVTLVVTLLLSQLT
ncbi:MAG: VIT family protein, partial [Candidatus Lokiarchaeum sp. GC14_75]